MTAFGYGATQPSSAVASPYILAQWGVPCGIAPNATWNNTAGSFTLGTALNETYSNGLWLRFAGVGVNSSTGGPASSGLYWCVMNSTTEGQAYALPAVNTVTSLLVITASSAFTPYIPLASQLNGLLPTTAGTHVQTTAAQITVANITIPANAMGLNGGFRTLTNETHNNSAGVKIARNTFGGSLIGYTLNNTTSLGGTLANQTRNRGVANAQVSFLTYNAPGFAQVFTNIDTTSDVALLWQINIATATDWMILQGTTVEMLPSS
jgi:hypothetical protein